MDKKHESFKFMLDCGVIPVIRAKSSSQAMDIVQAVKEGGINVIEITMTVPGALRVIEEVAKKFGDKVLVGAGTILDAETARAAILSGAEFIVGPQLNERVIKISKRYSKLVIPGAMTPTEIVTAWELGADMVKIFPAGNLGGPGYIKAIKGPLPQILLMPTGGVNLENAGEFIKAGATVVGVGSSLIDKRAVTEGKLEVLTERARKFVQVVREAREEI